MMNDCLSASAQMMAPVFSFSAPGRAGRLTEPDPHLARKRQKKAELDLLALQYSEEAMLMLVHVMRTSPDLRLRRDCANDLLNRGIGRTKPVVEGGQKAPDAENLLEVLAGISRVASANEQAQRALGHTKAEPKDVTPGAIEHDAEAFLRDLENDHE